jgi:diphosphomevalonate decarboxylase
VEGQFTWKAPSNIALVKYWGKSNPQIPKNASLSFTLSQSFTETTLNYFPKGKTTHQDDFVFDVFLDGEKKEDFKPKIQKYFENIVEYVPFLKDFYFEIHTHNSFPHSSGIASSASSFAALSLCVMSMEKQFSLEMTNDFFYQKAAFLARLGSGSATRSVKGNLVLWGKHPDFETSSDLFGIQYPLQLHPVFQNFQDTILLVDKGQKKVSSSVGHALMNHHPFAEERFKQANENIVKLSQVLATGNLNGFIEIVEGEALSLHAMMMTAHPYFILMQPNTLAIIQKIWNFRQERNMHVCFTLDAGANVHVLYPENEKVEVKSFIINELVLLCQNNQYICDQVGEGAVFSES